VDTDEYLARIGIEQSPALDAEGLRLLQARHLATVPFENLSVHLDEPISLDEDALLDKIVTRGRGGFCYELNGAFAALLRELGFSVTLLAGRVVMLDGSLGPPFDHLALRVDLDEPWLVDVGFGSHSRYPLWIGMGDVQKDPEGEFQVVYQPNGDLEVRRDGRPAYVLETRARTLADFAPTCWWQATSPKSHFTRSLTCSRNTAEGRITLARNLLIETSGDRRDERTLDEDEILPAYRTHFGITLDRLPRVGRGNEVPAP
jgi:N-hydroxyarylamine O-acetyltransferase